MKFNHKNNKIQIKKEFEKQFGNIEDVFKDTSSTSLNSVEDFEDGLEYEERINKQYENVYKKGGHNRK